MGDTHCSHGQPEWPKEKQRLDNKRLQFVHSDLFMSHFHEFQEQGKTESTLQGLCPERKEEPRGIGRKWLKPLEVVLAFPVSKYCQAT